MIIAIVVCALLLLVSIVLFPTWYISELAISFPLYLALGYAFLAMIVWFVKKLHVKWLISWLFVVMAVYLGHMVSNFYGEGHDKGCSVALQDVRLCTWSGLQVLFMNIRKNNYNYSGLLDTITDHDPDVLMMVEYADHHDDILASSLRANYPYSNRYSWSMKHIGTIVYSKYPINNLIDDYPQGGWRYGYFSVNYREVPYYIYMIHTSSPITYVNFVMRNRQLGQIAQEYELHRQKRWNGARVLMVGDFNITPWSVYYDRFVQQLDVSNATRVFPVLFTWRIYRFPLFWTHIDQLFVRNIFVENLQSILIPGSDHRGYSFMMR